MAEKQENMLGVLPSQALIKLIEGGSITAPRTPAENLVAQVQPASVDLRLGPTAYRLQSSFLPQSDTVANKMSDLVMYELGLEKGAILERGAVYLIPLMEELSLGAAVRGKTNPKSSTGRLDVFTRVITDNCSRFEEVSAGYRGKLYLEVVPRSFTIKVKAGQRLNQLRLHSKGSSQTPVKSEQREPGKSIKDEATGLYTAHAEHEFLYDLGNPIEVYGKELFSLYMDEELLFGSNGEFIDSPAGHLTNDGLLMSVDLTSDNGGPIGYKAKKNSHVIDLEKMAHYFADEFWEPIHPPRNGRLILEPEEFYIFASKERIRVPMSCAAEMVEFDAGSGELRTHYAGFFDPGFGYGKSGEVEGTKAVLEVRPHDVPFIIEDGQILFKMKYERMSQLPNIWYGAEIGSNYHDQVLRLAKQFKQI